MCQLAQIALRLTGISQSNKAGAPNRCCNSRADAMADQTQLNIHEGRIHPSEIPVITTPISVTITADATGIHRNSG